MKGTVVLAFILLLAVIAAAYYVGASTDTLALAKAVQQGAYALTGRTSAGQFASYPGGGGAAPTITF